MAALCAALFEDTFIHRKRNFPPAISKPLNSTAAVKFKVKFILSFCSLSAHMLMLTLLNFIVMHLLLVVFFHTAGDEHFFLLDKKRETVVSLNKLNENVIIAFMPGKKQVKHLKYLMTHKEKMLTAS